MKSLFRTTFFSFLVLVGLLGSVNGFSQTKAENIYFQALSTHLKRLELINTSLPPINKIIYMEKSLGITENIPDTLGNYRIILVDEVEIKKIVKRKKSIFLIRINPIQYTNNIFILTIVDFGVIYKKKLFHYTNTGGLNMQIKYNCDSKSYNTIILE
jgi:hypothetical protein